MNCRHCQSELILPMINLGSAPLSNAYLTDISLKSPEKYFPLRVLVCENCWLVQTEDFSQASELFDADYAYFSSGAKGWLEHAEKYVADMTGWLGLGAKSHVVEVAANDGYLLQYVLARGIPCLGIEPTSGTASSARSKGITIVEDFFGTRLARELVSQGKQADLVIANNVLAHVPDINDFVRGFSILLKPEGVATFEFPHLLRLIEGCQFDTIYHEHFSYLSLIAVERIFEANGLSIFDVEEHPTHGGSLRVFAQRSDTRKQPLGDKVWEVMSCESDTGITTSKYYTGFQTKADKVKNDFLAFLLEEKWLGYTVVGYGAAAKGNTLLNYAGVRPDLIPFVADITPAKQGKYLPGSRIPIVDESEIRRSKPDYVVLLPWNWKEEMIDRLSYIREWGGKFVVAVPKLEVL